MPTLPAALLGGRFLTPIYPRHIPPPPLGSLNLRMGREPFSEEKRPALALSETPSGRFPWGSHTTRVKLPKKANGWPLRASTRTQPVLSPGRA